MVCSHGLDEGERPHLLLSIRGFAEMNFERLRMKVVGKLDEGKLHVQFEVAGDGNQVMIRLLRHSQRKRGATARPCLQLRRHSLTLPKCRYTPMVSVSGLPALRLRRKRYTLLSIKTWRLMVYEYQLQGNWKGIACHNTYRGITILSIPDCCWHCVRFHPN